jgi:hypothetical protein
LRQAFNATAATKARKSTFDFTYTSTDERIWTLDLSIWIRAGRAIRGVPDQK